MRLTEITVTAAQTICHPTERFANWKPQLSIRATLEPGDDLANSVRALQSRAESLLEEHKATLLKLAGVQIEVGAQADDHHWPGRAA